MLAVDQDFAGSNPNVEIAFIKGQFKQCEGRLALD